MSLSREFLAQIACEKELSSGETEVLTKLFGSNKSRQEVADGLHISDSALSTRLGRIYEKFSINGSGPVKAQKLQIYLLERFQQYEASENPSFNKAVNSIEALVQEICSKIEPSVKERCGTIRVLDMAQPITLTGEEGIYTNVNIFTDLPSRKRKGIKELKEGFNPEEFKHLNPSSHNQEKLTGLQAIQRYKKLMVFGKPGSGKTTFLKSLAMQHIENNSLDRKIPIFISLGSFANTRLTWLPQYISEIFSKLDVTNEQLHKIFQQGKGLVLIDGLDEVREQDSGRVIDAINKFLEFYPDNQFLITCRLAATNYVFQSFTDVELADFDWNQISAFVRIWFCKDTTNKTQNCIKEIQKSSRIQELATNPLLLTLLCLVFEEYNYLPQNRAEIYREGVDVLLKKWDSTRNIRRDQIYQNLPPQYKQDLLSDIALNTFKEEKYLFNQDDESDIFLILCIP